MAGSRKATSAHERVGPGSAPQDLCDTGEALGLSLSQPPSGAPLEHSLQAANAHPPHTPDPSVPPIRKDLERNPLPHVRRRLLQSCGALLLTLLFASIPCLARSTTPESPSEREARRTLLQLRQSELAEGRAVELRDVNLDLGLAQFEIGQGLLIPVVSPSGAILEAVFVGQARFKAYPPNEIEAGQVQLFTGRRTIDTPVEEAVLVMAGERRLARLLEDAAPTEVRPTTRARAQGIHSSWLARTERRSTGVETALLLHLLGDELYERYFALWVNSYELGDFVYQLDPRQEEQITLGRFIPFDIRGWDRLRLERHIRINQRKGRWLGVRVEDLGAWDVWMSAPWDELDRTDATAGVGFEPEHYELDIQLQKNSLDLVGVAKIRLRSEASGRRAVRFSLYRDLSIQAVRDSTGRSLETLRTGLDTLVVLPEATEADQVLELEVEYSGRVLKWVEKHLFDLEDTLQWYPRTGSVDRATYNVKLAWPRKRTLIASGELVESGREGGYAWERRRIDRPAMAFSFVLGDFLIEDVTVGHVNVRMAFAKSSNRYKSDAATHQAALSLGQSLERFESLFGEYPLDYLTAVVLPRRFSQSFLGYMTLTNSILAGPAARRGEAFDYNRDVTLAHEVAHQWWGNLVGWWSYRDQWLSESMANYAALVDMAMRDGSTDLMLSMSAGWRDSLSAKTADGRVIESLGPVVLGERLNSSAAINGYRPIVYRKGAVVLAMLARSVGPDRFIAMLGELARAAENKVLTTESFLASIERMSGRDLAGFADRFIYGTGIPQVYYDYSVEAVAADSWVIRGRARTVREPVFRFDIVSKDGEWQVTREPSFDARHASTSMMVPYQIGFANGWGQPGQIRLEGFDQEFEIQTDVKPHQLRLDVFSEIFARFYPRSSFPRRVARMEGEEALLDRDWELAEQRLTAALDARDNGSEPDDTQEWRITPVRRGEGELFKIRLGLARLFVATERYQKARAQLTMLDEKLDPNRERYRMERDVLSARVELALGEDSQAQKRLKKTLRRASPRHGPLSWRALVRQLQLNSERDAMTEAFALLVLASKRTGQLDDLDWALAQARERGVQFAGFDLARREPTSKRSAKRQAQGK